MQISYLKIIYIIISRNIVEMFMVININEYDINVEDRIIIWRKQTKNVVNKIY